MRFTTKEYNEDIEVICIMLYISLITGRNFPTSCRFYNYIVLYFKYLEIFTDKKTVDSKLKHYENDIRKIFNEK